MCKQRKIDQATEDKTCRKGTEGQQAHHEKPEYDALAQTNNPPDKVVIIPEIAARFQKSFQQFYKLRPGTSLTGAYRRTIQHYFQVSYELHNGILVPPLSPIEQLPKSRQFRYWYKQQVASRPSRLAPENNHSLNFPRAHIANSMRAIPGHPLYSINAIMSNSQALSLSDPGRIIEQPIIYLIRDAFNQLILGIRVRWKQPNEHGCLLALENASMEEVQFYQALEVVKWPVPYHKQALLGVDPGKLAEYSAGPSDYPVVSLDIPNFNPSPSCWNWSPVIERTFHLYNTVIERTFHLSLTNASTEKQARRQQKPDYRLSSALTLEQFWAMFTSRRRSPEPGLADGRETTQ